MSVFGIKADFGYFYLQCRLWAGRSSCYICSCQWVGLVEGNQNNNLSGFLNEFSSREGLVLFSWAHAAAA